MPYVLWSSKSGYIQKGLRKGDFTLTSNARVWTSIEDMERDIHTRLNKHFVANSATHFDRWVAYPVRSVPVIDDQQHQLTFMVRRPIVSHRLDNRAKLIS